MRKSYAIKGKLEFVKLNIIEFIKKNKIKIYFLIFIIIVGLFTGIFTAIKYNKNGLLSTDYLIFDYLDGELHTSSAFWSRLLSSELMMFIVYISSLNIYLSPIGYFVIVYRCYLISFNCVLMILSCGLSGILTSLLIILPCQLLITILLGVLLIIGLNITKANKKYGKNSYCKNNNNIFLLLIVFICLILLIVAIETLLLSIFKSNMVLAI